jgi:NADH-quinone oxidoreductase subunit J
MFIYTLTFYGFAFFIVLASILVISAKNPVHSVLWLILSFFSTAGLFVISGAEFVAMILVIVYVGAVAVLFLFVVMMLNINYEELKKSFYQYLPLLVLISLVLFIDLYIALSNSNESIIKSNIISNPIPNPKSINNTLAIGSKIYTDYFVEFQLAGIILFIAMISAIVLTNKKSKNSIKQDIAKQVNRDAKKSVKLTNPKIGVGINGNL